jgi:diguanylate cyclase (GGDEF)-like protein
MSGSPPTRQREVIRLLLVEDDPDVTADIGRMLRSIPGTQFAISQAVRVEDALRMLRDGRFDVMLLDLSLKEGDGLEKLAHARVAAQSVPIIAITSQGDDVRANQALRGGAQDNLVKGEFDARLVAQTVGHAVERQRMLDELALAREREHFIATHDPLTGLSNRTAFRDQLARSLAYAERSDSRVALLILDVDGFKAINDSLGHPVGDELLNVISERLLQVARKSDMVARVGGDEFLVMLQPFKRDEDPARVAQRIIHCISRPCDLAGSEYRVTASIGVAMFPRDGSDSDLLIRNAGTALHHAKAQGRNRFSYYAEDMNEVVVNALALENDLRRAIECGSLVLHYQPQVDLDFGHIIGAEALVRWRDAQRGLIPPAEFISVAEETSLIHPLGACVLRMACEDAARWPSVRGRSDLRVAVNVSSRQLGERAFAELVTSTLRETGLDPDRLELEITESSVLQEHGVTLATIQLLRKLGVHVSIDDFGTGYSALSALKRLPVDGLKIDRSFVSDLASDPSAATITGGLLGIANGLGLTAIAEGVEVVEQMQLLRGQGCLRMQGYLFAKPIPAEDFAAQLASADPPWEEMLQDVHGG